MRRWYLNSIASRIAITIVLAIILGVAFQLATTIGIAYLLRHVEPPSVKAKTYSEFFLFMGMRGNRPFNIRSLAGQIATLADIMMRVPVSERPHLAAEISNDTVVVQIRDAPLAGSDAHPTRAMMDLRGMIEPQLRQLPQSIVLLTRPMVETNRGGDATTPLDRIWPPSELNAQFGLADGQWLVITMPHFIASDLNWWTLTTLPCALLTVVGLLSFWTARRLAKPISAFADAAERLGVDPDAPPLAERGPHELRTAIRAFNCMQERLRRFVNDRTQMVAAMSHDLKTPLTRLRLRAEFIEDQEQQRRMLADLDSMGDMIDSTLTFVRDDAQREPRILVDLGALVESVCENASDAGGAVHFSSQRGIDVRGRPNAISRAVANLIDNAVKYGGTAHATLHREPGRVIVVVDDDGPGIPADERENVFAPFYRLERSRNRDTGGAGLGLAVARTVAREHGGDITLCNIDGGGLRAQLELPV
ncbi:MAG TPA: ATP-binding protein [Xanthobacteraceae bacterium]|jgi:signal transduction histidine kinase